MSTRQSYPQGGKELANLKIYFPVNDDISNSIKRKNDEIVQDMSKDGEIPEKVVEFLVLGQSNISNF